MVWPEMNIGSLPRYLLNICLSVAQFALSNVAILFQNILDRSTIEFNGNLQVSFFSGGMPFQQIDGLQNKCLNHSFLDLLQKSVPEKRRRSRFGFLRKTLIPSSDVARPIDYSGTNIWPILNHCRRHGNTPAIKTIVTCPVNVLASQSGGRIAAVLSELAPLYGLRAGMYVHSHPKAGAYKVTLDTLITDREGLRQNPPDILLTDSKMLGRAREAPLWRLNVPSPLRFLMLQELDSFGSTEGRGLACLISRLKYRLGVPEGHLICIKTAGDLVTGVVGDVEQPRSAQNLFGPGFEEAAVFSETLTSPQPGYAFGPGHHAERASDKGDVFLPCRAADGMDQLRSAVPWLSRLQGALAEAALSPVSAIKSACIRRLRPFSMNRLQIWARDMMRYAVTLPWLKMRSARGLPRSRWIPNGDQVGLCTCVRDRYPEHNGCIYCTRHQVPQLGRKLAVPERVRQVMATLVARWNHLRPTKLGVEELIEDGLGGTDLERRFLRVLSALYEGDEALKPQVLRGGRRGFVLRAGSADAPRFWAIEPEVQMDIRCAGLPQKRLDFLLTPIGRNDGRSIAIKIDQSEYQANSVGQDLLECIEMIRSGAVYVWTVSERDLELDDQVSGNAFMESVPGSAFVERLEQALKQPLLASQSHADGSRDLLTKSSLTGLKCLLDGTMPDNRTLQSVLIREMVATGQPLEDPPPFQELSEAGQEFLAGPGVVERIGEGRIALYLSCVPTPSAACLQTEPDLRLLLRAGLSDSSPALSPDPDFSDICRGLWRLVNVFQNLRGFHVEIEGLDNLAPPDMREDSAEFDAATSGWREARTLCDVQFHPLIDALMAAEIPAPDRFGDDLTSSGRVVGMMEFGWSEALVAVSEQSCEDVDWQLIRHDPKTASAESTVVEVLVALQGVQ